MHLVDAVLLTELVKLAEEPREQINHVLRIVILRELGEADHVCVEEGHVI